MTVGTIYMGADHSLCEVVVNPETNHVIQEAKDAVEARGFRIIADAPCIGNFAVEFTDDNDLAGLQKIISGEVIESGGYN